MLCRVKANFKGADGKKGNSVSAFEASYCEEANDDGRLREVDLPRGKSHQCIKGPQESFVCENQSSLAEHIRKVVYLVDSDSTTVFIHYLGSCCSTVYYSSVVPILINPTLHSRDPVNGFFSKAKNYRRLTLDPAASEMRITCPIAATLTAVTELSSNRRICELRTNHQNGYSSRGTVIATPYLGPWTAPYMNVMGESVRVVIVGKSVAADRLDGDVVLIQRANRTSYTDLNLWKRQAEIVAENQASQILAKIHRPRNGRQGSRDRRRDKQFRGSRIWVNGRHRTTRINLIRKAPAKTLISFINLPFRLIPILSNRVRDFISVPCCVRDVWMPSQYPSAQPKIQDLICPTVTKRLDLTVVWRFAHPSDRLSYTGDGWVFPRHSQGLVSGVGALPISQPTYKHELYGSEASVLNTDVMLSMMMISPSVTACFWLRTFSDPEPAGCSSDALVDGFCDSLSTLLRQTKSSDIVVAGYMNAFWLKYWSTDILQIWYHSIGSITRTCYAVSAIMGPMTISWIADFLCGWRLTVRVNGMLSSWTVAASVYPRKHQYVLPVLGLADSHVTKVPVIKALEASEVFNSRAPSSESSSFGNLESGMVENSAVQCAAIKGGNSTAPCMLVVFDDKLSWKRNFCVRKGGGEPDSLTDIMSKESESDNIETSVHWLAVPMSFHIFQQYRELVDEVHIHMPKNWVNLIGPSVTFVLFHFKHANSVLYMLKVDMVLAHTDLNTRDHPELASLFRIDSVGCKTLVLVENSNSTVVENTVLNSIICDVRGCLREVKQGKMTCFSNKHKQFVGIGHYKAAAEVSKNETGGGEGIEVLVNEPFDDEHHKPDPPLAVRGQVFDKGQYTHKRFYLANKVPAYVRILAPKRYLEVDERAWNAYPYCRTIIENPAYMQENFFLKIESMYVQDNVDEPNIHQLPPEVLERREVVYIDFVNDPPYSHSDYDPNCDPTKFQSVKTGRGPLIGPNWWKNTDMPIMCAYKLVTCEFKWWGIQTRVETMLQNQERRIFYNFHRQLFCWMDKWHGLTMNDIRALEDQAKHELDKRSSQSLLRTPYMTLFFIIGFSFIFGFDSVLRKLFAGLSETVLLCCRLGNLAVSQPSCFHRLAWQLGTQRVLQLNSLYDHEEGLLKLFDDLRPASTLELIREVKDRSQFITNPSTRSEKAKPKGHVAIDKSGHSITDQPMEPTDRTANRD
ncbi:phosphatidylinositol transfer protein alpha isoform [Clonorchis sinensis]|uniref:Phosphatidylinositol transfer protein alpha isoform n=1 Tax=Clonorchis sinensis TaxID=79923 RepID=G7YP84_CLOSI|nr:phosphatidylinositol transfer protein alpha isoform [Clonorchis sinensis]